MVKGPGSYCPASACRPHTRCVAPQALPCPTPWLLPPVPRCRLQAESLPAWAITLCHEACQAYIVGGGSLEELVEAVGGEVRRTNGTPLPVS